MTFDRVKAALYPLVLPYTPDILNPVFFGPQVYPAPAFYMNFATDGQIDTAHSLNVHRDIGKKVCNPTRKFGALQMWWDGSKGLTGWTLIQLSTGNVDLVDATNAPIGLGKAIDLKTNTSLNSVAGVATLLPQVPDNFSYFALPSLLQHSGNSADALHIWVRNHAGFILKTRFYAKKIEFFFDGAWRCLNENAPVGGPYPYEVWCSASWNGDGTHTLALHAGTVLLGDYTGVLPNNDELSVDNIMVSLQSGATINQRAQIVALAVGPTQLPDSMTLVTPAFAAQASPTHGNIYLAMANVSRDCVMGGNVKVWMTKETLVSPQWVEVEMDDCGPCIPDPLDVTAMVHAYEGRVAFPSGSGTSMRAMVTSAGPCFPTIPGFTCFW